VEITKRLRNGNKNNMSKQELLKLEKENKYVFHGSPRGDLEVLEPRQGKHVPDNKKPKEDILDGDPAVSATPFVQLAIFRAIINEKNVPFSHNSGFGTDGEGKLQLSVSSTDVLIEVQGKRGFVYFFDKKLFKPYSRDGKVNEKTMEWRSYKPVVPLGVIEVDLNYLPHVDNIDVNG
jgi:hypothetical protein